MRVFLAAADGFLPRQLTYRGSRLVFSWGIVLLAIAASLLVIVLGAHTSSLIPLYAIGVFLSFTLSQAGMVVHMRRRGQLAPGEVRKGLGTDLTYDPNWRKKMVISAVGAVCTGVVMMVFAVTKFTSGAWFVVILIPAMVFVFSRIHNHYKDVAHALSLQGVRPDIDPRPVQTIILVDDVHAETVRMVNFAKSLKHPWKAVHISVSESKTQNVINKWKQRIGEGELVILESPYRMLAEPLRDYIEQVQEDSPGCFVHVIMGQLVMDTYWEQALHQNSAFLFNLALSRLERVVVTSVPYQISPDGTHAEPHVHAEKEAEKAEPVVQAPGD
jgi:uncharacterized protein (DUF983 family)